MKINNFYVGFYGQTHNILPFKTMGFSVKQTEGLEILRCSLNSTVSLSVSLSPLILWANPPS